jgi:hypothetical protein
VITSKVTETNQEISLVVLGINKVSDYAQEAEIIIRRPHVNAHRDLAGSRLDKLNDLSLPDKQ